MRIKRILSGLSMLHFLDIFMVDMNKVCTDSGSRLMLAHQVLFFLHLRLFALLQYSPITAMNATVCTMTGLYCFSEKYVRNVL